MIQYASPSLDVCAVILKLDQELYKLLEIGDFSIVQGKRGKKMEAILETTEIDISSRFNCDAERSVFAGKENKEEEENVVAFLEGIVPPPPPPLFQLFYLKIGGNICHFHPGSSNVASGVSIPS